MSHSTLRAAAAGLACVAVALTTACSSDSSGNSSNNAGPIVLLSDNPILTWDGDTCGSIWGPAQVYDSLVRMRTGEFEIAGLESGLAPGLATSWEYDEATTTYTFHLNEDAGFSNGQPLTADDVVFSVNTWKAGEVYGSLYDFIDHAVAVDEHTVQMVMTGPNSDLTSQLTWCNSSVYPEDFAGMTAEEYFAKPIGAGPYAIESAEDFGGPAETIHLVRNEHFAGPEGQSGYADAITIKYISDSNLRLLEFQSDKADIIMRLDESQLQQIPDDQVITTKVQATTGLVLNSTQGLLADNQVRLAVSRALDRTALATVVPGAVRSEGPLPPNIPGTELPGEDLRYSAGADVDGAKALLAGSGYPNGGSVGLSYNSGSKSDESVAQLVQSQLADIGLNVELKPVDRAALQAQRNAGQFEIMIYTGSAFSPWITERIVSIADYIYRYSGHDTAALRPFQATAQSSRDADVIAEATRQFASQVARDSVFIAAFNAPYLYGVADDVEGFVPNHHTMWYGDTLKRAG